MSEDLFRRARLTRVEYELGSFEDDAKDHRRRQQAPFLIVERTAGNTELPEGVLIMPIAPNINAIDQAVLSDTYGTVEEMWAQDFGFFDGTVIVIGQHEMGNWEEDDTWKGMHSFGNF